MSAVTATVDDRGVLIDLAGIRAGLGDLRNLYATLGEMMEHSIQQTFKDEGSPARSWPKLALATLRNKKHIPGSLMLHQSGRLFSNIDSWVSDTEVTIGIRDGIPYAPVQQFGSADRSGGSVGAQARIAGRSVGIVEHIRLLKLGYGRSFGKSKRGRVVKAQGPERAVAVSSHERFQNIPARPYVVFRPEDPNRLVSAVENYVFGLSPRGAQ